MTKFWPFMKMACFFFITRLWLSLWSYWSVQNTKDANRIHEFDIHQIHVLQKGQKGVLSYTENLQVERIGSKNASQSSNFSLTGCNILFRSVQKTFFKYWSFTRFQHSSSLFTLTIDEEWKKLLTRFLL